MQNTSFGEEMNAAPKAKRNTRQKEIVWKAFAAMRNHPTAEMVCDEVARLDPSVGRATVYRILNSYVSNGTAIKVPVYDGADRYDITVMPHSHAKCRICGNVLDVTASGAIPTVNDSTGFLVEGGAVLYYGVCRECQN
ncbi:MAG: transcriptional repressor [Clostridia bacterium]|nr:transcriptional repressor [Clostridia bacterium]